MQPVCESSTSSAGDSAGLRKRMEATCSGGSELKLGDATALNARASASDKAAPSVAPAEEQPDLTGERGRFVLLITLYALQGSLLGLASGTLPFLIQARVTCRVFVHA